MTTATNRFPGTCSCGTHVPAHAGTLVKTDGRFTVVCWSCSGQPAAFAPAAPTSRTITVERCGRRSYLRGDTLPVRGLLRDGGVHWDADQTAWWIGSHETAMQLAEQARTAPAEAAPKKRITHCVGCGCALDRYQVQRGFKFCSKDCVTERRMGSTWSGYVDGVWHQGSDD